MGIFNKNKKVDIYAPFDGKAIPLTEVPDVAFSDKLIGDGLAIIPPNIDNLQVNNITDQGLVNIFKTGHAISYEIGALELIMHLGIETVSLKGEGFSIMEGIEEKTYPVGTPLLVFNTLVATQHNLSLATPIVATNMEIVTKIDILVEYNTTVSQGDRLMTIHYK